jgi:two-component system, OmpR family, response regulator
MNDQGKRIILYCPGSGEESLIADILITRGYSVSAVLSRPALLKALCGQAFDLALFSFSSGQESVTDFSEIVRSLCDLPVIMVVGATAVFPERFKNSCDDFISSPVNDEELTARIEKVLSCFASGRLHQRSGYFSIGVMEFDPVNRVLHTPEGSHSLTAIESKLLYLLCLHGKSVLSRKLALETIWGENDYFKARSMDVYIARLRKLFKSDRTVTLSNIHNLGFRLHIKEEQDG